MRLPPHEPVKYGFDESGSPPSSDSTITGHYYPSFDNRLWMFYRYWKPPSHREDQPKHNDADKVLAPPILASLVIIHGTVDHSGVYEELAQILTKSGIAVIAMDMRGWGLSDGESMYFHDLETFCRDVRHVSELVHSTMPELAHLKASQRFLMGKSIGGLIGAFCVGKYHADHWKGGFLGLSGAYQLDPSQTPSILLSAVLHGILCHIPKLPLKPLFDETLIVSDKEALQTWRDDPLCCKDRLRIGYAIEILRATTLLLQNDDNDDSSLDSECFKLKLPLLIMVGDDDKVVSGHQELMEKGSNPDKELITYPKGRHNLLQEPSLKEKVMNDILTWILKHATKHA